jgi:hypothetical protein
MELDISKRIEQEDGNKKTDSTLVPAEVLAGMGLKPNFKPTEKELNEAQQLIIGATQLMHNRLTGKTEFGISQRQFEKFQNDVRVFSKLVITGYKSYKEFYKWIEKEINMPDEIITSIMK